MRIAAAGADDCMAAAGAGVSDCPEHPVVNSRIADVSAPTIVGPTGIVRVIESRPRLDFARKISQRPAVPVLVTRLRDVVVGTTPDFVFTDETEENESLFGPWHPSRNPCWT
ncbi:hypothetical protein ACQP08_19790 [Micromonospora zamorensis]|uniref:hypothetical protein n=1 Tax=Micromonospora zamorensis TaxID=709883 RepID=UPI003D9035FA